MQTIHARYGFVLPTVLGIILITALFAVHAATEMGSTALLANQRLLHQRAFEAGESGIVAVLEQLQSGTTPPPQQLLRSAEFPGDAAAVQTLLVEQQDLPSGYSIGRVAQTHYEVRSAGHSARATTVTVVQGVQQLQALPAP